MKKRKTCTKCQEAKHSNAFYKGENQCKACRYAASRAYRAAHPEKVREWEKRHRERHREARKKSVRDWQQRNRSHTRAYNLRRNFGITPEEYDRLRASQAGRCAICGQPETMKSRKGHPLPLCVDHDHTSGKIRGLLCNSCNIAIGNLRDDPGRCLAAANYLEHHNRSR